MKAEGIPFKTFGIRIDSGDLAYLSKQAYKMLCDAGFPDAVICASSDLDEFLINSLKEQGAMINSWGVGTNLITAKGNPSFGGVYKLAAVKNSDSEEFIPKIKLSENTEKITNPGNKKIYRIYDRETGKIRADLICLEDETFTEDQDILLFDPIETWKKTRVSAGSFRLREVLIPVFKDGTCVFEDHATTMELRQRAIDEQNTLWDESRRLINPHQVYVDLSDKLFAIKAGLLEEMSADDFLDDNK
jgi:nicotinate phosphoribosyltransferase